LGVTIVGGLNFSRLTLSMALVTYFGFDRLGNPQCCRFGHDTASADGASR
jgi:hypothetical protein